MKIDIYKSIFLLILGVFVYCYYLNSLNGRFVSIYGDIYQSVILDSKSGATFKIRRGHFEAIQTSPSIIK